MNTVVMPPLTTIAELSEKYQVLLFDAYGVLVRHGAAIRGAAEAIDFLNRSQKPYYILTNDSSKSAERSSEYYRRLGVMVPADNIISSGRLIADYFERHNLRGARCLVIGTADSRSYVREAGGEIVALSDSESAEVIVLCDDEFDGVYPALNTLLNAIAGKMEKGERLSLLLANPDLIYPCGETGIALAVGSIAGMLEQALEVRFPGTAPKFCRLGKPFPEIFEFARSLSGTMNMVMIGDQLSTDILGACRFGIDSALCGCGVSDLTKLNYNNGICPTYLLPSL